MLRGDAGTRERKGDACIIINYDSVVDPFITCWHFFGCCKRRATKLEKVPALELELDMLDRIVSTQDDSDSYSPNYAIMIFGAESGTQNGHVCTPAEKGGLPRT